MAKVFRDQVVLVTGASSGIGEALARELARRGAKLALCARRVDRLDLLAAEITAGGGEALVVPCDVTRDGEIEAAIARTVERFGRLDVAVANAGFGVTGPVEKLTLDDFRRQFETNVFGVVRTAYAALAELKKSAGTLVLVGSVSSYLAAPNTAAYAMSKFAVRAFAEAVTDEWRPLGVSVVLINPGFVESEIRSVNNQGELTDGADPVPRWLAMPREDAASDMADAIAARRREQVLTGHGRLAVLLSRHAPWVVQTAIRLGAKWDPTAPKA